MNTISYFEIQADDPESAVKFYSAVFGWEFVLDKNIPITYWRIEKAGIYGGLLQRQAVKPAPKSGTNAFTCSMHVESFDTISEKILKNGGVIALEKFAVKGKCWQGYFLDPEGNVFGIFQTDDKAE